jgi:hypothetical protein
LIHCRYSDFGCGTALGDKQVFQSAECSIVNYQINSTYAYEMNYFVCLFFFLFSPRYSLSLSSSLSSSLSLAFRDRLQFLVIMPQVVIMKMTNVKIKYSVELVSFKIKYN